MGNAKIKELKIADRFEQLFFGWSILFNFRFTAIIAFADENEP